MSPFPELKPDAPITEHPIAQPEPVAAIVPDLEDCKTVGFFECSREQLVSALQIVIPALERKNTIPILGYVLIRASAKTVTIEGTDLDVTARHTIGRTDNKAPVVVCLPAFDLLAFAKAQTGDTISIAVESGQAKVTAGATRTFATLPPADFPTLREYETPVRFNMSPGELRDAIRVIRPAINKDVARYYLNGMFFEPLGSNAMQITATDGHRLHTLEARCDGITAEHKGTNVIVPAKTLTVVEKWLGSVVRAWAKSGVSSGFSISFGKDGITFVAGPTVIRSKVVHGTFPDYRRVVPGTEASCIHIKNAKRVTFDSDTLLATVNAVHPAKKDCKAVRFHFHRKGSMLASGIDDGFADSKLECTWTGGPLAIGFNPNYVRDLLNALGSGTVELTVFDPSSPAIWRRPDLKGPFIVLSPMWV